MNDLPPGWATAQLDELISADGMFVDGDWVESKDQDPHGAVRLTQLADIGEGLFRDRSNRFLTLDKARKLRCSFLEPGDVLIARMPAPLGRACLYPGSSQPAVTVVDVCIIRPGSSGVNPRWMMWIVNSPQVREQIKQYESGTTRKRISRRHLALIRISVPPRAEQDRIVTALDDHLSRLDSAIRDLALARARLHRYRQARLWSLTHLAGDMTETVRLSDLAEVRLGRQRSPKNHVGDSMRPYLRAANVGWDGLLLDDVKEMNFTDREAETYELRRGDILLGEASGSQSEVGKPALWMEEIPGCCFQNTLLRVRPHRVSAEFLLFYLRAEAQAGNFGKYARGVGIHHLGAERMAQWPIALPKPDVQEQISYAAAHEVESLTRLDETLRATAKRAGNLRRSLLAEAFAGRLVPQDVADEPAPVLLSRIRAQRSKQPHTRRGRMTSRPALREEMPL